MRLTYAQSKPWEALGISRATWYRLGKPGRGDLSWNYHRQKSRTRTYQCSIRSVQRQDFVRRYGVEELASLARHQTLSFGMLEDIAKWEHEDCTVSLRN